MRVEQVYKNIAQNTKFSIDLFTAINMFVDAFLKVPAVSIQNCWKKCCLWKDDPGMQGCLKFEKRADLNEHHSNCVSAGDNSSCVKNETEKIKEGCEQKVRDNHYDISQKIKELGFRKGNTVGDGVCFFLFFF
jgi:hypothetical protein